MMIQIRNDKGVTLIEIIAVLVLVSILAAGAGMGIIAITQGYIFASKNAEMAQKTNIAIKRISRELQEIITVSASNPDSITFESLAGKKTIGFHDNAIKLSENEDSVTTGDIIIDEISSLMYTTTFNVRGELTGITYSFDLLRSDVNSGSITFTTTVYIRNNKNSGGSI